MRLLLFIILSLICCTWAAVPPRAGAQQERPLVIEEPTLKAWNALVENITAENTLLNDLQESFRLNRTDLVVMPPDVRASLRERRLKMIDDELKVAEERIKILREMRRAEATH
ncbi:MAG: hypothetical protein WCB68_12195 [Pyrinomonadaceae bacterium]